MPRITNAILRVEKNDARLKQRFKYESAKRVYSRQYSDWHADEITETLSVTTS